MSKKTSLNTRNSVIWQLAIRAYIKQAFDRFMLSISLFRFIIRKALELSTPYSISSQWKMSLGMEHSTSTNIKELREYPYRQIIWIGETCLWKSPKRSPRASGNSIPRLQTMQTAYRTSVSLKMNYDFSQLLKYRAKLPVEERRNTMVVSIQNGPYRSGFYREISKKSARNGLSESLIRWITSDSVTRKYCRQKFRDSSRHQPESGAP